MTDKVPPYKTPAGVEIGKYYTPPLREEFSFDEERIQRAFLSDPLGDGLDDLGKIALASLAVLLGIVGFLVWVTI